MTTLDLQRVHQVGATAEEVDDFAAAHGWSDGLPVVAPTGERVAAMGAAAGEPADTRIGPVPVSGRIADVQSVAVNAVLAGCRPAHFPAVLATLRAVLEPAFNLAGVQATTHPCAPLAVFGGPVVDALGINCGAGVFGPGTRANAVIGRAVRLVLLNVGEGIPGTGDEATFGQPGKFTYVAGENEDTSPWPPLRVDHEVDADASAVTVFAAEAPHNVNDHGSTDGRGVLVTVAGTMRTLGNNNIYLGGDVLVLLGPEHAALCARDGLTKDAVAQQLFELARVRAGELAPENRARFARIRPDPFATAADDDLVPIVASADNVVVTVTGGPGRHSMVVPTFGASRTVTRRLDGKEVP
ncbi:MAG: hypothetical protein GEV07_19550 [Streptosporangiales bacterium]|nr:hypothetical protein [Streptosporangiales bacterium]